MLLGETLATGCPVVCPDCQVNVLPLRVLRSNAGYYIGTRCDCGPAYTRESDYYSTPAQAEAALADRSFGRGGVVARGVALYWPNDASPDRGARSFDVQMRQARERKRRFVAQILGGAAGAMVDEIDAALLACELHPPTTRRLVFTVTILHNAGPGRYHRYLPSDPLIPVFDLTVEATSLETAAEVVFAIANSWPDQLLCNPRYAPEVAAYRAAGCPHCRSGMSSLSVGDVLRIRAGGGSETWWACAWTGFDRLAVISAYPIGS
jgi:hypothetical protein